MLAGCEREIRTSVAPAWLASLHYPVRFFDALGVKIREEGRVGSKAVYWRWASPRTGSRRCWGIGLSRPRAKFWLRVLTELQARGVRDILFAVVDGLKGFPAPRCRPASCTCCGIRSTS